MKVLVEEIDSTRAEISKTKVDLSDQVTVLAKGLQALTPEVLSLRPALENFAPIAENANSALSAVQKLRMWTESGFRRLNEAMTVQQQALTIVDSQLSSIQETLQTMQQVRADVKLYRKDTSECRAEVERLRLQLLEHCSSNDRSFADVSAHVRSLRTAVDGLEAASEDREQRLIAHSRDLSRLDATVQDLHVLHDRRITALEGAAARAAAAASGGVHTPTHARPDRRVVELEADLERLRGQLVQQDEALRSVQRQLERMAERPPASAPRADPQALRDAVAAAVNEHLRRNPAPPPFRAPLDSAVGPGATPQRGGDGSSIFGGGFSFSAGGAAAGSGTGGGNQARSLETADFSLSRALSPPPGRPEAGAGGGAAAGTGVFAGALGRVMQDSQRRVANMRQESEQRHAALTRAVEEIDSRIRGGGGGAPR
jgi:hypothetical protein